jgi:hypothetical protein
MKEDHSGELSCSGKRGGGGVSSCGSSALNKKMAPFDSAVWKVRVWRAAFQFATGLPWHTGHRAVTAHFHAVVRAGNAVTQNHAE